MWLSFPQSLAFVLSKPCRMAQAKKGGEKRKDLCVIKRRLYMLVTYMSVTTLKKSIDIVDAS